MVMGVDFGKDEEWICGEPPRTPYLLFDIEGFYWTFADKVRKCP
jgi:hypothetical protein